MAVNIPVPDYSNATTLEQKFEILADSYNMLRKELDYVLQNLSTENFNSIFANNITAKNLKGGNININDAFIVDGEGNVIMDGTLNIAGLITVDEQGNMTIHGGQMTWASSDPKIDEIDSDLSDVSIVATTASGNIAKLANGTYIGGTFITGKSISSPYIEGGKIEGIDIIGSYFKGSGANSAYIMIGAENGIYGDLRLCRGSGGIAFQIHDNAGNVFLGANGGQMLATTGSNTVAYGAWDFSDATVTGVPLRFSS